MWPGAGRHSWTGNGNANKRGIAWLGAAKSAIGKAPVEVRWSGYSRTDRLRGLNFIHSFIVICAQNGQARKLTEEQILDFSMSWSGLTQFNWAQQPSSAEIYISITTEPVLTQERNQTSNHKDSVRATKVLRAHACLRGRRGLSQVGHGQLDVTAACLDLPWPHSVVVHLGRSITTRHGWSGNGKSAWHGSTLWSKVRIYDASLGLTTYNHNIVLYNRIVQQHENCSPFMLLT